MALKVLVTGAGALLGQGIIRALRASSLNSHIVAVDPNPLSAGLYWADSAHLAPRANDPFYLESIRKILSEEKPDAVMVGTDVELYVFSAAREELERDFNTQVFVSSPDVIAIADDKWLTYEFLKRNGFDYPESCLPGAEEALIETVGFPLIVKPRVGARSVGVHVAHTRDELQQFVLLGENVVIQECVGTAEEEYTAGSLSFAGQRTASIVMRRDLRDGNTYRAFVDNYPDLMPMVQLWSEKLKPYGPANFQFRVAGGRAKVFEINARFSGTTPLRVHAGFNEVEMTLRHVLWGEPVVQPPISPLVILRHWSETVIQPELLITESAVGQGA